MERGHTSIRASVARNLPVAPDREVLVALDVSIGHTWYLLPLSLCMQM